MAKHKAKSSKASAKGSKKRTLNPCPKTPNCVSSRSTNPKNSVEPFIFNCAAKTAMAVLKEILAGMPGTTLLYSGDTYIHAECKSLIFRFVDDLEFLLDKRKRLIHVRSASRTGYYDFGVNRRRVESIRKKWLQRLKKTS